MATDAAASASSRTLPALGTYLRTLFDLGRRSVPAALPALAFLWFYHFGTALYLEVAGGGTSPLGYHDNRAQMIQLLMKASAYLPLLVLVYTPFLPLQDSILRGEPRSFLSAVRHVLERMIPFVLSSLLQLIIVLAPVAFVLGILVAALAPLPVPRELVAVIAVATIAPLFLWLFVSGLFLAFAIPGVVLSGLGATRSISASARLVASHFWGVLGRFLVFFLILIGVVTLVSLPSVVVTSLSATTPVPAVLRIASILWSSLVTALTFPFWVGALIVLYRALVPGTAAAVEERAPGAAAPHPAPGETSTPFLFE